MDALGIETILFIVLAFFCGTIAMMISEELKILLLAITGALLALFAGKIGLIIDEKYVMFAGQIALALYLFEYTPKLEFGHFDKDKRIAVHYLINSLIASLVAGYIVYLVMAETIAQATGLFYFFIFSLAMFVTVLNYAAKHKKGKVMHILSLESNTSVVFGLASILTFLDLRKLISAGLYDLFLEKLLLSIGIGIIAAIILLRFASQRKHHKAISFGIILITLFAADATAFAGIALFIAALMFARFNKEKVTHTFDFFRKINSITEIIVVIFAGFSFMSYLPKIDGKFILLSLTAYAVFLFIRFFVTSFFAVSLREKIFITLNNPKGAIGALIYLMLHLAMPRYDLIWALFFMQVIFSEIVSFFSHSLEDPRDL